jgi:hypothetical protein
VRARPGFIRIEPMQDLNFPLRTGKMVSKKLTARDSVAMNEGCAGKAVKKWPRHHNDGASYAGAKEKGSRHCYENNICETALSNRSKFFPFTS